MTKSWMSKRIRTSSFSGGGSREAQRDGASFEVLQSRNPCPTGRRGLGQGRQDLLAPTVKKRNGRARAGTRRSPLWRGGGTIFGPMPRDYSFSLPKKVKRAALKAALSLKRQEGKLILLNDFPLEGFKTRQVLEVLRRFQVEDALIVTDERHLYLERSARNIPGIEVLRYEGLNVYDILNHDHLILLRPTVEKIEGALAS